MLNNYWMRGLWFPEKLNTPASYRRDLIWYFSRKSCFEKTMRGGWNIIGKTVWMQRSTQRVNITDWFLEHHIFFSFWCISFLCTNTATRQEPVQGFKWYQRKKQTSNNNNNSNQTMAGRESSLEPILLGEWIGTPVLYCIFGCPLSHLRSLLWNFF